MNFVDEENDISCTIELGKNKKKYFFSDLKNYNKGRQIIFQETLFNKIKKQVQCMDPTQGT